MSSLPRDKSTTFSTAAVSEKEHTRKRKPGHKLAAASDSVSWETTQEKSLGKTEMPRSKDILINSKQQETGGMLLPIKPRLDMVSKTKVIKISRQRPHLHDLAKLDYASFRRSPVQIREEILKNKVLSQELTARLAEAKLSLAQLDPVDNNSTSAKQGPGLGQPPGRVSFLSVSRRVANIIRFRQAAQPRKPGMTLGQISSMDTVNLPKTPRFSSYMSPAAQYALMKGYEDIIFEKLSSKYPECTGMLKRNKTPHHSIDITNKATNFGAVKLASLNHRDRNNLQGQDHVHSGKSLREYSNETKSRECEPKQEPADGINAPGVSPEMKVFQDVEHIRRPEAVNELLNNQISPESSTTRTFKPSALENHSRIPSISTQLSSGHKTLTNQPKYKFPETFSPNYQQVASIASAEPLRRDRRILLSYRMENAMDILDTMKTTTEQALSPRVKIHSRPHITPLLDFNRWADQWADEFNSDVVK